MATAAPAHDLARILEASAHLIGADSAADRGCTCNPDIATGRTGGVVWTNVAHDHWCHVLKPAG